MGKSSSARLRVKSDGFKFELEGREEFVSAEYPKLLATLGGMARALVVIRVKELGAVSASARGELTDLDREMQQLKQELDSLSELGETESLRLQMAMDRMSKTMSTLSNLLKKISDTAQSITQNLK
jgi:chromosome segregation ATPase